MKCACGYEYCSSSSRSLVVGNLNYIYKCSIIDFILIPRDSQLVSLSIENL